MERRFYKTGVELRASQGDEGSLVISGRAASFNSLSENLGGFREQIRYGAFTCSLQSDRDVKANFNHDNAILLGRTRNRTLELNESSGGLDFRCTLPPTQAAADVYRLVQKRYADSCSFAFAVDNSDGDGEDWGTCTDPETNSTIRLRTLRCVRLFDVSVLSADPAYPTGTDVDVDDDTDADIFLNKYRSVSAYFPDGVPESFPVEIRSTLQRSKVIGVGRRNLLNFILQ